MKRNNEKLIYIRLLHELQKNNKLYYEKSSPIISDKEYDNLKKKKLELEKKKQIFNTKQLTISFCRI